MLIPPPRKASQLLLDWYSAAGRDLPWRRTRDPWKIMVSEIMLQQTRVAAVIPYYQRFLERYSEPRDLAQAPEQEFLAIWSGLGYYSRARNLQRAGFRGRLFFVNPHHRHLGGLPVYPDVAALPEAPDLAVIATPPAVTERNAATSRRSTFRSPAPCTIAARIPRRAVVQKSRMRARNVSSSSTSSPPAVVSGFVSWMVLSKMFPGVENAVIAFAPTCVFFPACTART